MKDGDTSPKIKTDSDLSQCVSCHRTIHFNELYGAHGLCSQCLAADFDEHHGA
jgi:hypothetical protein